MWSQHLLDWIGRTPDSEEWFWVDGTPASQDTNWFGKTDWIGYTNWQPGEPNNWAGRDEDATFMNLWLHLGMLEPWALR